jgi:glutathione S-transferase
LVELGDFLFTLKTFSKMASKVIIYGSYMSQPTRFVIWTSTLLNIPFEFKKVDAAAGEQKAPEFLKMNPNAVFPVLQEPASGFVLYESNAIARYLSSDASNLYPTDKKMRALVDQWLEWKHGSLRQGCAGIVRRKVMKNLMKDYSKHSMAQVFVEVKEEREARQLIESLQILEDQLRQTKAYIVAETKEPTLADIAIFEEVEQLNLLPSNEAPPYGSNIGSKFPHVAQWQKRMRSVPKYDEVHKDLAITQKKLDEMRQKQAKL